MPPQGRFKGHLGFSEHRLDLQHGTRFATSATSSHPQGCSATHVSPAEALRRRRRSSTFFIMHQCVRVMCDRCFSMTGATILSGVGPSCVPCVRACRCPACHTATTARKGAAWPGCSAQARRRFGPPFGACVHGRLHATAWHAGWRHTGPEAGSTKPETAPRCAVYQARRYGQRTSQSTWYPTQQLGLAEPWLRVMSRKVFYSETDASGMS